MQALLKIFGVAMLILIALVLYARFSHPPERFLEGSVSAQRLERGPWTVGGFEETFVDRSRPTPPNGDFAGRPERVLEGDVWYPVEADAGSGPLLVFSHGFTSLRASGRYLAEHLAAHGFVVVAVDYPLTSMGAPGGPMLEDVVNQPGDIGFLIDTLLGYSSAAGHALSGKLDPSRIGVLGISLGGLTATLAAYHLKWRDPRIGAVLSIAGPSDFFTPLFFARADVPFMMLAGELDALVPWASNAAPVPEKLPGATLVTVRGGSHTGFSGGMAWLRWMRNTDALGCYSVLRYIDEEDRDGWPGLFGSEEEGLASAVDNELCQLDPLPKTIDVLRQHMISKLVVRAFFESTLGADDETRRAADDFLINQLSEELADVSVVRSSRSGSEAQAPSARW